MFRPAFLGMEVVGIHEGCFNSIMSLTSISARTFTPTPSFPVAPPCTPVSLTVCRRRSPPWLLLGFPLHLPGDVDLQAGVRRGRPRHRPPQVLLNYMPISKRLMSPYFHPPLKLLPILTQFHSCLLICLVKNA